MSFIEWLSRKTARPSVLKLADELNALERREEVERKAERARQHYLGAKAEVSAHKERKAAAEAELQRLQHSDDILNWEINGESLTAQFDTPTSETWFVIVGNEEGKFDLTHDRLDNLQTNQMGDYDTYSEAQEFAEAVAKGVSRELNQ